MRASSSRTRKQGVFGLFRPAKHLIRLSIFALLSGAVFAQASESELSTAKALATSGHRAKALANLERYLANAPQDVDARFYYGVVLSWESRYDDARRELKRVLKEHPDSSDAILALVRIEIWSGHRDTARHMLHRLLEAEPRNVEARSLNDLSGSYPQNYQVSSEESHDWFSGGLKPWNEVILSLKTLTPLGSAILRGSQAARFGLRSNQEEVELYPHIRKGLYAYLDLGYSDEATLYPKWRMGAELFKSAGHGFEVSGGLRRLWFANLVNVYTGSLTKHYRNWNLAGRTYVTPGAAGPSVSAQLLARQYFGEQGDYWGIRFSRGATPTEIRGTGDIAVLDSTAIAGELNKRVGKHIEAGLRTSFGRETRLSSGTVSHSSASAYVGVAF